MILSLDNITAEVLQTFRLMLLGPETKLVFLEDQTSGLYNIIGRARKNFFLYNDPTGDVIRLFVDEKFVKPEDPESNAVTLLEQCFAVGYYGKSEKLNVGEYLVYSFLSRKAPFGAGLRLWEFHLSAKADIFSE